MNTKAIAVLRIATGISQMTMAFVTLGLYLNLGLNRWSIGSLTATMLLVTASRIAFEQRLFVYRRADMKRFGSEFIGTFALVFAGTGAIIINETSDDVIAHVGIALTFGLVVLAMIYTLGAVCGAHLNPAVTIGFWISRRLASREVMPYVASQCAGALAASGVLRFLFPQNRLLGATQPAGSERQSFVLEFLLSAMLMFVILGVSTGAREKGITAASRLAQSSRSRRCLLVRSGASMNPARSLGPALVSDQLSGLWIYLVAPVLGGVLGVLGCRCVREPGCCSSQLGSEISPA